MSAWVVSNKHISSLLDFASRSRYGSPSRVYVGGESYVVADSKQKLGQMLLDENYRSVNHRYGEENGRKFKPVFVEPKHLTPVQILKSCNCYDYQACETDDYYETKAAKLIQQIRKIAIGELAGYDDAEWGI